MNISENDNKFAVDMQVKRDRKLDKIKKNVIHHKSEVDTDPKFFLEIDQMICYTLIITSLY